MYSIEDFSGTIEYTVCDIILFKIVTSYYSYNSDSLYEQRYLSLFENVRNLFIRLDIVEKLLFTLLFAMHKM